MAAKDWVIIDIPDRLALGPQSVIRRDVLGGLIHEYQSAA
jgi:hypothetical protein